MMLQNSRQLIFRPSPAPALLSPVTVRSAGHYRVRNWHEDRTGRDFSQIFWIADGQLAFQRKGERYEAGQGSTFFYPAGEPHMIDVTGGMCDYWWVTFDGPLVGNWLNTELPEPAPRTRGPCPVELMRTIRDCVRPASPVAERDAAILGLRLLMDFAGGNFRKVVGLPPEEKLCSRLEAVLEEHYTDAGLELRLPPASCNGTGQPCFGPTAGAGESRRLRISSVSDCVAVWTFSGQEPNPSRRLRRQAGSGMRITSPR
jgi:hypothetical protein